ncbi:hypothetical protein B0H17DRAFT_649962 [Mycena rosella]|uniref:Uncharacterized protein n=1 Tax=Mycena rosella TaxID=1033263 RepID=A0AAD7GHU3_MYCRO|nr:hypothetical protein B0H17DRAFT_649962 [Mycena rosella]
MCGFAAQVLVFCFETSICGPKNTEEPLSFAHGLNRMGDTRRGHSLASFVRESRIGNKGHGRLIIISNAQSSCHRDKIERFLSPSQKQPSASHASLEIQFRGGRRLGHVQPGQSG